MAVGFKVKNIDLQDYINSNNVETFTNEEFATYKISKCPFTDGDGSHKKTNKDLNNFLPILSTAAGDSFAGGNNIIAGYKKANLPISIALKGRRPIGKPLLEFNTNNDRNQNRNGGWYTIYRQNGKTYYAAGNNITTGGTLLDPVHNPEYLHIELCGGGGGSAGNSNFRGGGGGGAGAYIYVIIKCDKVILKIGNGGAGGRSQSIDSKPNWSDNRGRNGGCTSLWFDYNGYTYKLVAAGGNYGAPAIARADRDKWGGPEQVYAQWCNRCAIPRWGKKPYNGVYEEDVDGDMHWELGKYQPTQNLFEREINYANYPDPDIPEWEPKDAHPENQCKPTLSSFNNEVPLNVCRIIDAKFGGFGLARDAEGPGFAAFQTAWNEPFNRPENYNFSLGPHYDGYRGNYAFGGGGGPSVFNDGAPAKERQNGTPGNKGAGASGASYDGTKDHHGAEGGFGVIRIYY